MGISSNQARLMTLVSRQHDLELRAQSISAKKMITSMESQEMATKYSDALNNYSLLKSAESAMKQGDESDTFTINSDGTFKEDVDGWYWRNELFGGVLGELDCESSAADAKTYLDLAQSDYDKETAKLSAEEKQLDMELTQINTEHEAVKTEYDSVKSLVSDNTDKSFNVFS